MFSTNRTICFEFSSVPGPQAAFAFCEAFFFWFLFSDFCFLGCSLFSSLLFVMGECMAPSQRRRQRSDPGRCAPPTHTRAEGCAAAQRGHAVREVSTYVWLRLFVGFFFPALVGLTGSSHARSVSSASVGGGVGGSLWWCAFSKWGTYIFVNIQKNCLQKKVWKCLDPGTDESTLEVQKIHMLGTFCRSGESWPVPHPLPPGTPGPVGVIFLGRRFSNFFEGVLEAFFEGFLWRAYRQAFEASIPREVQGTVPASNQPKTKEKVENTFFLDGQCSSDAENIFFPELARFCRNLETSFFGSNSESFPKWFF